ncbi:MAG TPA: hypothetical protein VGK50_02410 [Coriobacteriia bacterium]|jgi:predicted PurR-regulated permease PerM
MPFRVTSHEIALVFMIAGVLSVVLNEPLARLDSLIVKGGPFGMERDRHRLSSRMILVTGFAMVALALALVVR